ncbi:sugar transferase [Facklamia sp. P12955]|uniref:sugar transferase n=1 Tax=Facklamia sp. P12955 TaxID=3421946 RepID=UPI003D17BD89
MYRKVFKRLFDLIGSLILLPIVLLIILIFGMLIYLEDKGSPFYFAKRRGKDGSIFKMIKLRSMYVDSPDLRNADNSTYNSPNDPRITKIGKFIRKTSIDEIPQILNVLKGDMSFIGPRPITVNRPLSEYDEKRKIRLLVKPGITGYSQAYFRNSISQEKKLKYDAEYAQNVTFIGDLKILFKTIQTILFRNNVYIDETQVKGVREIEK